MDIFIPWVISTTLAYQYAVYKSIYFYRNKFSNIIVFVYIVFRIKNTKITMAVGENEIELLIIICYC